MGIGKRILQRETTGIKTNTMMMWIAITSLKSTMTVLPARDLDDRGSKLKVKSMAGSCSLVGFQRCRVSDQQRLRNRSMAILICLVAALASSLPAQDARGFVPCAGLLPESMRAYRDLRLRVLQWVSLDTILMVLVTPLKGTEPTGASEYGAALRGAEEGAKIIAARALENIWERNDGNFKTSAELMTVPIDPWEAAIDADAADAVWKAFRRVALRMSYQNGSDLIVSEGLRYEFYVVLPGIAMACGEIEVTSGQAKDYALIELTERMMDYARSTQESRPVLRGQMAKIAHKVP